MLNFLEKLRALPEGSRKGVVLFSSAGITAVILLSWLVFPTPHFGSLSDEEKERKSAENLITPFSVIGGEIQQASGDIKDKWASFGGTAGLLSAVSSLKENMGREATSTATSTLEGNENQEAYDGNEGLSFGAPQGLSFVATTTDATTTIQ